MRRSRGRPGRVGRRSPRAMAHGQAADVPALAGAIRQWQSALWKFRSVSYSFDGTWQMPVDPLAGSQAIAAQDPGRDAVRRGRALPRRPRCRRWPRGRRRRLASAPAGDRGPAAAVAPRRPRRSVGTWRPVGERSSARRREYLAAAAEAPPGCDREQDRGARQVAWGRGRCPGRLARLPRDRRRGARQDRQLFRQEDPSR